MDQIGSPVRLRRRVNDARNAAPPGNIGAPRRGHIGTPPGQRADAAAPVGQRAGPSNAGQSRFMTYPLRPTRHTDGPTGMNLRNTTEQPLTGVNRPSSTGKVSPKPTTKPPCDNDTSLPSMAKGGTVKKTGKIKAHKGEVVIPVALVKKLKKLM